MFNLFNPLEALDYKKTKEFWTNYTSKVVQFWKDFASDIKVSFEK